MIKRFTHTTNNNIFTIESYTTLPCILTDKIQSDYEFCSSKCKQGCKNYGKKYSCPPSSKDFYNLRGEYSYVIINAMVIKYDNIISLNKPLNKNFNLVKACNVICKSQQRKLFDKIDAQLKENDVKFYTILENGSCRLCRTCALQKQEPCKHPDKKRDSLEATGVDVNKLVKDYFNFSLQWYQKGQKEYYPEYQCVVSAVLFRNLNAVKVVEGILEHVR